MSDENNKDAADDSGEDPLDRDLRALFQRVQDEPVSEELKRLARILQDRLKSRDTG